MFLDTILEQDVLFIPFPEPAYPSCEYYEYIELCYRHNLDYKKLGPLHECILQYEFHL